MNFGPLGIWEILIIVAVAMLIFGPARLPAMARGVGRSVREVRDGLNEVRGDLEGANDDPDPSSGKARNENTRRASADGEAAAGPSSENAQG